MPKAGEKFEIKISSILGGISPTLMQGQADQFQASIGIDPDLATNTGVLIKTSGVLRPSAYSKFSSTGLSGYPKWLLIGSDSVTSTLYTYASDGELIEYSNALSAASENVIGIPTGGGVGGAGTSGGRGAAFYNNFVYCATSSSVARLGPLSAAGPVFNNDWWGNEAGLTTLQDTPYPTNRSIIYPNHPMYAHNDGVLYFGDYDSGTANTTRGRGMIHYIKTQFSGATEGIANNGSTYNALSLPFGYMPTAIAPWGTDLVIAAIPFGSDQTLVQGKAKLFFWDTIPGNSYYRAVELPDPLCTALLNSNGTLYIWTGNANNGVRVSVYNGGYSIKQVAIFEEGMPPLAGAVDAIGNRVAWGVFTTYPENSASVYALGYKNANLPQALHNIVNSTSTTGGSEMVTAIKYAQHASFSSPRLVVGWQGASSTYGIDKLGSTFGVSVYRSLQYAITQPFRITKLTIPLGVAVAANMVITPTFYTDDGNTSSILTVINPTNFPNSEKRVVYENLSIEGRDNFFLELRWSGTDLLPVTMPIIIEGEYVINATG